MFRFLIFIFLYAFPIAGFAANTQQQQPVYDRIPKGFGVPGARLGDILIHPSAKLVEVFNNNIYATGNNTKSDFITKFTPAISAQTLNKQRGFNAELGIDSGIYRQFSREDYNELHADFRPYVQVTKASKLDGQLAFHRLHEARTSEAASNNIGAEALGSGSAIIAHDNHFNHWVAGSSAVYFKTSEELEEIFNNIESGKIDLNFLKKNAASQHLEKFQWLPVLQSYERVIQNQL